MVLAAIVLFLLTYAAAVALSLPGASLLTILGGFLFGWLLGGVADRASCHARCSGHLFMARPHLAGRHAGCKGRSVDEPASREAFATMPSTIMLFLRLVPGVSVLAGQHRACSWQAFRLAPTR
jgi:uncharacterized membrane protein YdjX (TVP38/TMEM64 family)